MRIGVQLPEVEREARWPELVAIARAAEEVGFDSLWVGDHLLYRDGDRGERGPWEAWTLLAALAVATTRVSLGPLVACLAFHPPAVLAKMAATVDEVSGGRLELGVGAGWNAAEFAAFGLPYDHRVSRFAEAFEIVRGMLAGERVTVEGRYWRTDDAVLLPPPAREVPLTIGSNGPRMLALTLPAVSAWNTWYDGYGNTADGFATLNARITSACEDAGRPPGEVRRSACAYVVLDRAAGERPISSQAPPIEGSAGDIASRVAELADAGADEVILVVNPITERAVRDLGDVVARLR